MCPETFRQKVLHHFNPEMLLPPIRVLGGRSFANRYLQRLFVPFRRVFLEQIEKGLSLLGDLFGAIHK